MLTDYQIKEKLIKKENFTEKEAKEVIFVKNLFNGRIVSVPDDDSWRKRGE